MLDSIENTIYTIVDPQLTPMSRKIVLYQEQLKACNDTMKQIKKSFRHDFDKLEKYRYERTLAMELKRKTFLIQQLTQLGIVVEKRGRPRMPLESKSETHKTKFTAKLKNENLLYLEALKEKKQIDSISGFLEELIQSYRKKMSFSP